MRESNSSAEANCSAARGESTHMIEKASYGAWHNTYRFFNDTVELVVVADVGPRVIRYSFIDEDNIFHEVPEEAGLVSRNEFRLYGGHRLWAWPEIECTYFPDNRPVATSRCGRGLRFTAPVEDELPGAKLQKEFEIMLEDAGCRVTITHRITNRNEQPCELAVWCPTMMRPGGRAILPLAARTAMDKDHYQSVGPLTLWSYTDLADPRWIFGTEFIQLRQESHPQGRFREQITGTYNPAGWSSYYSDGTLFVKRAAVLPRRYPDFGCNFEIFTNPEFLELETLAPIAQLGPGETSCHVETWDLFRNVPDGESENWIRSSVVPLVTSSGKCH
jgi:hypothetical protein